MTRFRARPPPAATSKAYEPYLDQVKAYGARNSTIRSAYDTQVSSSCSSYYQALLISISTHKDGILLARIFTDRLEPPRKPSHWQQVLHKRNPIRQILRTAKLRPCKRSNRFLGQQVLLQQLAPGNCNPVPRHIPRERTDCFRCNLDTAPCSDAESSGLLVDSCDVWRCSGVCD